MIVLTTIKFQLNISNKNIEKLYKKLLKNQCCF